MPDIEVEEGEQMKVPGTTEEASTLLSTPWTWAPATAICAEPAALELLQLPSRTYGGWKGMRIYTVDIH